MRTAGILMLLAGAACEQPSKHVYSSPPPTPNASTGAAPAISGAPEIPIGTLAAGARLVSVTDAATGAPVALGSITDSVDVLTLVAFGPGEWAARHGGRIELAVRGPSFDTTLVRNLGAPAPSIAAHTFRVGGLMVGRYSSVVRLRSTDGSLLAESIPLLIEVVAR
ncbi:MAG: hypothetical protein ABIT20_18625 [Gemmatimonadaceae bacterium]